MNVEAHFCTVSFLEGFCEQIIIKESNLKQDDPIPLTKCMMAGIKPHDMY